MYKLLIIAIFIIGCSEYVTSPITANNIEAEFQNNSAYTIIEQVIQPETDTSALLANNVVNIVIPSDNYDDTIIINYQINDTTIVDTGLIITEIDPVNTFLQDYENDDPAWIELYNPTNNYINLKNYYLTKNINDLQKWKFTNTLLAPKTYLIVFLSDKNLASGAKTNSIKKAFHANFSIKNNGGIIYLTNGIDIQDSVKYPVVPVMKTWSLKNNIWGFAEPNPLDAPQKIYKTQHDTTGFYFPKSGFYDESINLKINFEKTTYVFCTFDGSMPTVNKNLRITANNIKVDTTTVIRCIASKENTLESSVITRNYIFEKQPTISTMLITGDNNAFFNVDSGIYMNGPDADIKYPYYNANFWKDYELPINVEFFEKDSNSSSFCINAGYKIKGGQSRAKDKKSFAIYFKEKYGTKSLKYKMFNNYEINKYKSLLIRNNGNNFENDYIRDRLIATLTNGLDIDYQQSKPTIVYYNGKYFGIHNIRERTNVDYIIAKYGYEKNEITLVNGNGDRTDGNNTSFTNLIKALLNGSAGLTDIDSLVDIDNFLTYYAVELYVKNTDWPANNAKLWQAGDRKWKFIMYDMDYTLGMGNEDINMFTHILNPTKNDWRNSGGSTIIFKTLMQNDSLKNLFLAKIEYLANNNFASENFNSTLDSLMQEIEIEIPRDQEYWHHDVAHMSNELIKMKTFILNRQKTIMQEMKELNFID